jgi:Polyketide cyclase / dehydrase and lipid transport
MRAVLRADTSVAISVERLWDLLVDWPRQREWIPLTRVRTTAGDGRGVGGRIEAWTGVGRVGFLDPMVITRWDPPWSCEVLHTGPTVRGEGGFEVRPDGVGARVVWWESLEVPWGSVGAVGWRLTAPGWRIALERALDRLRALAEADESPGRIDADER